MLGLAAFDARGQGLVRDEFEGPEISLRDAGGDATYRIEAHTRVSQGAHGGQWCERLTVRGTNGTFVYVSRPIAPALIIGELEPSVWLKADRPGVQLLARVMLPRTRDPQTGRALTALVRGSAYATVGSWQQLRIENLPKALEGHVRVLRAQYGPDVDPREAYVDTILINAYGGPGLTTVWIDDLELAGVVSPQAMGRLTSAATASSAPGGATLGPPQGISPGTPLTTPAGIPSVERSGPLLLVGGKPFFPRIVEHRGEPAARLRALGFNTVWLTSVPSPEFLREASGAGLWIIAPPPPAAQLEARNGAAAAIDGRYDPVLAWDLGRGLAASQLEATRQWAKLVRAADARRRPMIVAADSELTAYTRPPIQYLLARRDVLGTSLQFSQYTAWLRERAQLALTGTTLWAAVQTEPPATLLEQMSRVSPGRAPAVSLDEAQLRTLVHAALAGGARGLCFTSSSRLDADDELTRRRAAIVELVNLELDLIERWPATGNFTVTADSSDQHAVGAVIETDRSRLLMPMYTPPNSQLVTGSTTANAVSYKVRGVPEEDSAYELSLVGLRPLTSKRVAGGTQVTLGELERDSLVVFTQDQVVFSGLQKRLKDTARRAAELARALAVADQVSVEVGQQRLTALGRAVPATRPLRMMAQENLRKADEAQKSGDVSTAYYQARHALAAMRLVERIHFEELTAKNAWVPGDPLAASFATLPEHVRLAGELQSAARSADRLPYGNCENLQQMIAAGWKHFRHPQANITTAVDLSPQAAHSGNVGLRLRAAASDAKNKPGAVETPPMWVTTAAVAVEPGQLLEIRGWVRIPAPIAASSDGLLVIDSLGGEPLAQRLGTAAEWQQFTIYRGAIRPEPMTITFALTGLGEVWIDDVSVQVVNKGALPAPPAPQAQQFSPPAQSAPTAVVSPRSLTGS